MEPTAFDTSIIQQVNQLARQSAEKGFDPFAAILVKDNVIVAQSKDKCIQYADPTAHAELILISEYCRTHQLISLEGYTLYCNVEPCVMCSGAIHWSRISRVVFSVPQSKLQEVSKGKPKPSCHDMINIGHHQIKIMEGVLWEEGLKILMDYPFQSKKKRFEAYNSNKN